MEILDTALARNTMVCMGTGTGKTFIAVMLVNELAHQIRLPFENSGKRTFFLVNTGKFVIHPNAYMKPELLEGQGCI